VTLDATLDHLDIYDVLAVAQPLEVSSWFWSHPKAIFPESNSANPAANIEFLEKLPRPTDETILRSITWIWMPGCWISSH